MKVRLPSLIVAVAAVDIALLAQNAAIGVVSGLIACAALVVAFSEAPVAVLAMALVAVVLIQAGVLSTAAVPGVSQIGEGWATAEQWKDHQIDVASCHFRQLAALESSDAALEAVERECA